MSKSESRKPPPNVWMLSSDRNPYVHNVLVLLGIDPDGGGSGLLSKCHELSGQLEAGLNLSVQGRQIKQTDIARGHDLVKNAEVFVAERLLTHTFHVIDPLDFKTEMQAIESLPFESPESLLPLAFSDLSFLRRLLPELPELQAATPVPLSPETLHEAIRPEAAEEYMYDF